MAETNTVDIAQKPTPAYLQTVLGHLKQQSQPQSFWENPASRMIPFVGPILHTIAATQQAARVNQATMNTGLFDTLVQQGHLPEDPATAGAIAQKLGIPVPLLQAGMLEAQQVRATPAYQGRQLFREASPGWQGQLQGAYEDIAPGQTTSPQLAGETSQRHLENFQAFAQQNPEIFGTLGNPETGRIAMENITTPYTREMLRQEFPGVAQARGGRPTTQSSGGQPSAPLPPVFQTSSPELDQALSGLYTEYSAGQLDDAGLKTRLEQIPGMTPDGIQGLSQGFAQLKAQGQAQTQAPDQSTVAPLKQFDPNAPRLTAERTITLTNGKVGFQIKKQTVQEAAAAYVLKHTLDNPNNYLTAIDDVTRKGVVLDPKQEEAIRAKAIMPMFMAYLKEELTRAHVDPKTGGVDIYQAGRLAIKRMELALRSPLTKEQSDALQDPSVVANAVERMKTLGGYEARLSGTGQDYARAQTKEGMVADLNKQGSSIQQIWDILEHLNRLYQASEPQKGAILASLDSYLKNRTNFGGLQPKVREYKDAVIAMAGGALQSLAREARISDKDIPRFLQQLDFSGLTGIQANTRTQDLKRLSGSSYKAGIKFYRGSGDFPLEKELDAIDKPSPTDPEEWLRSQGGLEGLRKQEKEEKEQRQRQNQR